ncbi:hypothetical protein IAQ61_007224, partial [Plenodomus lingam]|uniref:uncharacterized protein n=1 Tax=Leptosphaeria maculans TaxID=5022 RepID=UPI00331F9D07
VRPLATRPNLLRAFPRAIKGRQRQDKGKSKTTAHFSPILFIASSQWAEGSSILAGRQQSSAFSCADWESQRHERGCRSAWDCHDAPRPLYTVYTVYIHRVYRYVPCIRNPRVPM